tara:strand:+ start:17424 stop:18374 length:951 start_codon:yes stop_codon:yes gene_type:complete
MTTTELQATIPEEMAGLRLDKALADLFPQHSRARLQQWLKDGQILVDDKKLKAKEKVTGGEVIQIDAPNEEQTEHIAQDIPLAIIYEDDDILVINKAIDMVVHPAAGNADGTILNAVLHHHPASRDLPRAGIVHRLDKDTSGLMVIAKTLIAHTNLVKQLQAREIKREYLAIVNGTVTAGGTIDEPIGRHSQQRMKMAVHPMGKEATTHYRIAERFHDYTLLHMQLESGRTHQIRVHLAYINFPIVGDQTYGGRLKLPKNCDDSLRTLLQQFKRQALHAYRLGLEHPITGEPCSWQADIPDDIQSIINGLREFNHA